MCDCIASLYVDQVETAMIRALFDVYLAVCEGVNTALAILDLTVDRVTVTCVIKLGSSIMQ